MIAQVNKFFARSFNAYTSATTQFPAFAGHVNFSLTDSCLTGLVLQRCSRIHAVRHLPQLPEAP